jgi:hypothetical protein
MSNAPDATSKLHLKWRCRTQLVSSVLNGPPSLPAERLGFDADELQRWARSCGLRLNPRSMPPAEQNLRLNLLQEMIKSAPEKRQIAQCMHALRQTRGQKSQTDKSLADSRRFMVRAVNLIVNGGLPSQRVARELKIPLKILGQWKRQYLSRIRIWPLTFKEVQLRLNLLAVDSAKTRGGT